MYEIGIPPPHWFDVDDSTLATILQLLGEQHDRQAKAQRKAKRRK